MSSTPRTDHVTTPDGDMDLFVWLPDAGHGPGILLLQEIFGVGAYLRAVAERLQARGYVVGAPDVFWRIQRNWEADHTEEGLLASLDVAGQFFPQLPAGIADCVAALHRLEELPEVDGGAGVLGFCLGGLLAYHVAAQAEPAAVVSYYGSGIAAGLAHLTSISCPLQLHFGGNDPYIPIDQVTTIAGAVEGLDHVERHVQHEAVHAFDNHEAPMFHDPRAAEAAWALTVGFFEKHLPTD